MEPAGNNPTISVQDHNYTYMFNFEQVTREGGAARRGMSPSRQAAVCLFALLGLMTLAGVQVAY